MGIKMKISNIILIIILLLGIFIYTYVIQPSLNRGGVFFRDFNVIYCTTESICWHEVGHFVDKNNNKDASYSISFGLAINKFSNRIHNGTYTNINIKDIEDIIYTTVLWLQQEPIGINTNGAVGFNPNTEIYAEIYRITKGEKDRIPPEFKEFYK
jgi:hypothetical protein